MCTLCARCVATMRRQVGSAKILSVVRARKRAPGTIEVYWHRHYMRGSSRSWGNRIMRTNPFFDAWQFIVGLTDVPYAEGIFKYGFLVFFLALLGAAALIAYANWRTDPAQRTRGNIVV